MTYEEAKKHLNLIRKGFGAVIEFGTVEEAIKHYNNFKDIEIILKALEKQIPKKPKCQGSDEQDFCFCPICDNPICTIEDVNLWDMKQKYCDRCGQALDWSE